MPKPMASRKVPSPKRTTRHAPTVPAGSYLPLVAGWHGINVGNNSDRWQLILNQSWPLVDEQGKRHARGVPSRSPIAVRVRVVFDRDGETWLDGQAIRWHNRSIMVEANDPRLRVHRVWVDTGDVQRIA
jgi:hypothetical protein